MRNSILLIAVLLATTAVAKDEIYKWLDKDGVIHYGSTPPLKDAKPADLPPLQSYQPAGKPTESGLDAGSDIDSAASSEAPIQEVRVTSPAANETIRDAQGVVPVSAAAKPGLPPGGGFVFYLDGSPKNKKIWLSSTYVLTEVERGEHSVVVAVVDRGGRELKRSPAVVFYFKPPQAR